MGAPTRNLSLYQPDYQSARWDQPLNVNFQQIDNIIGATSVINVTGLTGGVQLTQGRDLTSGLNSALALRIAITGTPTSDVVILTPANMSKTWIVINGTTGGKNVFFGGTTQSSWQRLTPNTENLIYCDGIYAATVGPSSFQLPSIADLKWSGSNVAQPGWLMCDGTVYSNAAYPALATRIGARYGGTAGSTFAVPNLVGRVIAGMDVNGGVGGMPLTSGLYAGYFYISLDATMNGVHSHGQSATHLHAAWQDQHAHGYYGGNFTYASPGGYGDYSSQPGWKATENAQPGTYTDPRYVTIDYSAGGVGHNNVQPTVMGWAFMYAGV
jgi:microcystin-dependent protein